MQCRDHCPLSFFAQKRGENRCASGCRIYPKEERKIIGVDIMTVQFRWPLGMPLVDNIGGGVWEVRSKLPTRIARTLFFVHEGEVVPSAWLYQENEKNSKRRQGFGSKTQECLPQKQQEIKTSTAAAASRGF